MKSGTLMAGCCFALLMAAVPLHAEAAKNFEVEGHRGARWWRPENTLSAFRFALELGVDTLEMDLNVTKDDVLVVTHDPALNPAICLDPAGKPLTRQILVRSLTLKELQAYDCGTLVNPRFPTQVPQPKEKIPSFEELLTWLEKDPNPRAKTVMLNVETKSEADHPEYTPEPAVFSKMVLDAFKKHQLGTRAILQSFDYRTLVEARKLDPEQIISALVENRPHRGQLAALARQLKANIISPNEEWLKKSDVDALHAIGVKVVPWTANNEDSWKKLVEFGVDGIISDNPKGLLEFRAR